MSKIVNFERSLDNAKRKRKPKPESQYRKGDMKVIEYCAENPLNLPPGVEVHKLFYPKGEEMHPDLAALFSEGLPRKGMASMKSILYGHVLGPITEGSRYENFSHKEDSEIMGLKNDIIDLIDDPFWKKIESGQKFGSYAWHGYKSLIDGISHQYDSHGNNEIPDWISVGIQRAVDELPSVIDLISLEESIAYCKTDTNSGFPCFTSKPFIEMCEDGVSYKVLNDEIYSTYYAIAKQVWEGKAHHNLPAILFKRIQPGEGTASKTRIVECVSRGILWAEARFWRPLLEAMRTIPCYYGYMHYSDGMDRIIEEALGKEHVSSLDYTRYDAIAGKYLPVLFRALARKYPEAAPLLLWCAVYYRECPLLTPHGWIQGEHGLFSGMFGTSFAGSLLNRGLVLGVQYAINEQHVCGTRRIIDPTHLAFGDDTVYAWNGDATLDDVLGILSSGGFILNADKQEYCGVGDVDKFVMFQACYWRFNPGAVDHCVPVYPLVRCSARLAFIEYLDANTKIIYGAGYRVNECDCPEVVGPIITTFIAKLMEAEHHPYVNEFINVFQGTWVHNLNPLLCVSNERVLRYVKSEIGYLENTDASDFLHHPICKALIDGLERIPEYERIRITRDELILQATNRKYGNSIGHSLTSNEIDKSDFGESLMEAFGHSQGLLESILLHIPMEAM